MNKNKNIFKKIGLTLCALVIAFASVFVFIPKNDKEVYAAQNPPFVDHGTYVTYNNHDYYGYISFANYYYDVDEDYSYFRFGFKIFNSSITNKSSISSVRVYTNVDELYFVNISGVRLTGSNPFFASDVYLSGSAFDGEYVSFSDIYTFSYIESSTGIERMLMPFSTYETFKNYYSDGYADGLEDGTTVTNYYNQDSIFYGATVTGTVYLYEWDLVTHSISNIYGTPFASVNVPMRLGIFNGGATVSVVNTAEIISAYNSYLSSHPDAFIDVSFTFTISFDNPWAWSVYALGANATGKDPEGDLVFDERGLFNNSISFYLDSNKVLTPNFNEFQNLNSNTVFGFTLGSRTSSDVPNISTVNSMFLEGIRAVNYNSTTVGDVIYSYNLYTADNGYSSGYSAGFNDAYNSGYDEGYIWGTQDGRVSGYNNGYTVGYDAGVNATNIYSFNNLFGAVLDVPVQTLTGLFNWEFLGVNLFAFIGSLLTIFVIIFIIKIIKGGK